MTFEHSLAICSFFFYSMKTRKTQIPIPLGQMNMTMTQTIKAQCTIVSRSSASEGYLIPLLAMCGGG